jgi:hypothetical protein
MHSVAKEPHSSLSLLVISGAHSIKDLENPYLKGYSLCILPSLSDVLAKQHISSAPLPGVQGTQLLQC